MTTPPTGTRSSLKEKQRQEREDLILQVAEEVINEKGYHDASMDEIALRVGISKGTLYLHFASKEALLLTLVQRFTQGMLREVNEVFASPLGPRAKLEALILIVCRSSSRFQWMIDMRQNPEMQRIFTERQEQWRQAGDDKRESMQPLLAEVRALLEAGKTTGEFDASVPTDIMLSAFLTLLSPLVYQRLLSDKQIPPETLAEYLGRIYFHGITTH